MLNYLRRSTNDVHNNMLATLCFNQQRTPRAAICNTQPQQR